MKKEKKQAKKEKRALKLRPHRVSFLLNEEEHQMFEKYLAKYKIENRSRWMRETVLTFVLTKLVADYPTLFTEDEMGR